MTLINKSLIAALSFLFFLAVSPLTQAAENPFGMIDSADSMQLADSHKGKCGEGKCGDSMKKGAKDGKCGEGKCGDSMKKGKCGEGKCGEGKCGDSMKKDAKKGKCGEGKCGGN